MKNPYQLQDERKAWRKKPILFCDVIFFMMLLSGIAWRAYLTEPHFEEPIQHSIFYSIVMITGLYAFPVIWAVISLVYPVVFAEKYPLHDTEEKPILKKFFAWCGIMLCFLVGGCLTYFVGLELPFLF
jgi:hypothetical protein